MTQDPETTKAPDEQDGETPMEEAQEEAAHEREENRGYQ